MCPIIGVIMEAKVIQIPSLALLPQRVFQLFLLIGLLMLGQSTTAVSANNQPFSSSQTFTVTKTADTDDGVCDADCSLREAVQAANANVGADVINLPAGTYLIEIAGSFEDLGATGDFDILDTVTIVGAGTGTTIIDADSSDRIFDVDPDEIGNVALTISQVTLQNGYAPESSGGAIRMRSPGGNLTVSDVTFLDNTTDGSGGAIESSTDGALATISDSLFDNNSASCYGGAIASGTSPILISNSIIKNNLSFCDGGGINIFEADLTVQNSLIEGNLVGDGGGNGGGINFYGYGESVLTVEDSTIQTNTAVDGGGISTWTGEIEITNTAVMTNTADMSGGGLYLQGDVSLTEVTIAHNYAGTYGGGIQNFSQLTATETDVVYNEADISGGGVFNSAGATFYLSNIAHNLAGEGGGIFGLVESGTYLEDSFLSYNSADYGEGGAGGGFYGDGGALTLNRSTVSFNYSAGDGGGIYANQYTFVEVMVSTISNNDASYDGGGIYASEAYIYVKNSTVAENNALEEARGGGLYNDLSSFELESSLIANNYADTGPDCNGDDFTSNGFNLIGNGANCTVNAYIDADQIGTAVSPIDPRLGSLRNNGGPTNTHSLLPGSPAIDNGAFCVEIDQRFRDVPIDGDGDGDAVCDVGAFEADFPNVSWTNALPVELDSEIPGESQGFVSQYLDEQNQSRWYRFEIEPGSALEITLSDLPANYDLVLYKDIAQTLNDDLNGEPDLVELSAEFAPDIFSPDIFSPDIFSPDIFSPDIFSPDIFSPDIFSPDIFSPDIFSPDIFSPDIFSPDIFSPDIFSPDIFSPDIFSPDIFSPDIFSEDPDKFASAQLRSILAASGQDGTISEKITVQTWNNTGEFYIRVRGRYGAFDTDAPFSIEIKVLSGQCGNLNPTTLPFSTVATAGNYKTLILTDLSRMAGTPAEQAEMLARLNTLAARPEVAGTIVDLGADPRIVAANADADANFFCPYAKNLVAEDIKTIIKAYSNLNPDLEYLVIVGNDDVIPFYRHPDRAMLANESNYVPPVDNNTASQASLRLGYVLGQDWYGTDVEITSKSGVVPVPQMQIGRLVEVPTDVITVLDAYLGTANGVVDTPDSALVTGYDFLVDAAEAVEVELEAGLGTAVNTLITPSNISPADPRSWSADDLRNSLFSQRHDVIYLAGHFSAFSALAADYQTRVTADEIVSSPIDFTNSIIFSTGCHSGYNIVNEHGIPQFTVEPDWAQAFAQKGATLIAGSGYQYGDTDFIEYNERLYQLFAQEMRAGTGPVTMGEALNAAKIAYLAETPQLRPLHEKSLIQVVLYGLPMLSVDMPSGRGATGNGPSAVGSTTPFATKPGSLLGLEFADLTVSPSTTVETKTLNVIQDESEVTTTYLVGPDGVISNPYEPVLPVDFVNVSVDGQVMRGVGFRGGSYTDLQNVLPLTGSPTTEIRGVHAPFISPVFFPIRPFSPNYYGAFGGGDTLLSVLPGQYLSDGPISLTGSLRRYSSMDFRLYYSNNTTTYTNVDTGANNTPALAAPPAISNITAVSNGNLITFSANVQGDPSAGLQEVWVTYTAQSGPLAGQWQSLSLTQDPFDSTLWTGTLDIGTTLPAELRFMVQAVNGVGLVSLDTNRGEYYIPDIDYQAQTPPTAVATTLSLQTPPTTGAFGTKVSITAQLSSAGNPVANELVTIALGPQSRTVATNAAGEATAQITLLGTPGAAEIRANFAGTAALRPSSDTAPFTITKQGTALSLDPVDATVAVGAANTTTAVLTDAQQRPLFEETVVFIVSNDNDSLARTAITDFAGRASLGSVNLPPGTYTVEAFFASIVTVNGVQLDLTDDLYGGSQTVGTLTINLANNPPSAVDDDAETSKNTAVTIDVLDNDSDPDGDDLTVIEVSTPANGTAVVNPDNTVTYTPALDFVGQDSFTYTIEDESGATDTATVTVTVEGQPPIETSCDLSDPNANIIIGTEGNDIIRGTHGNDIILGLGGHDRIYGLGGDDCIDGGDGNDFIHGHRGNDILIGGNGNDFLWGSFGDDIIFGGDGDDRIVAGSGDDIIYGGDGDDKVVAQRGDDWVEGNAGNDHLIGAHGEDTLLGGPGDDKLIGGGGLDFLDGGDDIDFCKGGGAHDTVINCEKPTWKPKKK